MVLAAGRRSVDVTATPFAPLPYGLKSVAYTPDLNDPHWQAGIDFQPFACNAARATTEICPSTEALTKVPSVTGIGAYGANAFTVYAWVDCGPVGAWDGFDERSRQALLRGEDRAIENVFWSGITDGSVVNPHLAANTPVVDNGGIVVQTAATVVATGVSSPVVALGLLEGSLSACLGGQGIIHVPSGAVTALSSQTLIQEDDGRLRTTLGNSVAVYSSNNRQGPTGAAAPAGQAWFYATGPVTILQSDVFITAAEVSVDRSKNKIVQIAERTYLISWNCCHFAAQVTLT